MTDDLSFNVGVAYDFSGRTRVNAPGGERTFDQSGFEDPTFGLTWRAIDERSHPVSLDLFTAYSPDVVSSTTANGSQDASVARGGPEFDVGAALARETRFFTIRGEAKGRYFGVSTQDNLTTGATVRTASYWVPSLGVETFPPRSRRPSALNITFPALFLSSVPPLLLGTPPIAEFSGFWGAFVAFFFSLVPLFGGSPPPSISTHYESPPSPFSPSPPNVR